MSKVLHYDPRWSLPNTAQYLRQYLMLKGVDEQVASTWDSLGETAYLAYSSEDEKVQLAALKECNAHTRISPKAVDALSAPTSSVRPLHINLQTEADLEQDQHFLEVEEEANALYGATREPQYAGGD